MALCEHPERVAELADWQVLHQCGTFDPAALQCKAGDEPGCLTGEQVGALDRMYAGAEKTATVRAEGISVGKTRA